MNAVQLKLGELEIHLELEAIQVTRKVSKSVVLLHLMSLLLYYNRSSRTYLCKEEALDLLDLLRRFCFRHRPMTTSAYDLTCSCPKPTSLCSRD